ncbi:MAG: hypothetical protein SFY80_15345 [Verrucomicrobiota bacterium]|nr:hypothetical protein [Verrucomicrobiota bacterium]
MSNPITVTPEDRNILRNLARQVADIAALPIQQERIRLWKKHNSLQPERPMILIFPEGSWGELLPADTQPHCSHPYLRQFEHRMRMSIYEFNHFDSDNVITASLDVPKVVWDSGWGINAHWIYSDQPGGARKFDPVINDPSDLKKLVLPKVLYDEAASLANLTMMQDILGDILSVKLVGIKHVSFHLMSMYTSWRGLEETMVDMMLEPNWVHDAMEILTEGHLGLIKQHEEMGLYELNYDNTYHSTGGNGWSDESPLPGYDATKVRAADMWASAESQELSEVSPAMHQEFAMKYEARLLSRFRHNGYGCCEGLHNKMSLVHELPNVRRISMSPFCNIDKAIPQAANRSVISSWKPHPARLVGEFQPDLIRQELRHGIELAKAHNSVLEIILKDTATCERHPERFTQWSKICREEVERSL